MKWLQDNPVGLVMAAVSGVFVLLALVMTIVWNLPVAVETPEIRTEENDNRDAVLVAHQVADISDFQVINEKPVFNESRLPVIVEVDDDALLEDTEITIKDAPDVRLTGVIITPGMKIASLTPANGQLENVMAHEGQALTGEFVGWWVSRVDPRTVVLKSRDGQQLELELQVHDTKLQEPPKPTPSARTAQTGLGQGEPNVNGDGQPLSRAEQIRQRIAERREELRLEQEEKQAQEGGPTRGGGTSNYQNAIRSMMDKSKKEDGSNDEKDR